MSRIGKNPVEIPGGVEASLNGRELSVKGPKGQLAWTVPFEIDCKFEDNAFTFSMKKEDKKSRALWGTSRAITQNMVTGVSQGFERKLEINGIGYRAAMQGNKLNLSVGYSHPVNMDVPAGLTVAVNNNTEITVNGPDKQAVGEFAAVVRRVRPPEPYKGKGIRFAGENLMMKEGKKK